MAEKPFPSIDPRAERMVERQLVGRGIRDPRVLEAMRRVPRSRFLPPGSLADAYVDAPVSIGCGQTMSQPYMVALMLEALGLRGEERVLEVGTGSGYQTALLALLAREVYSVERIPELAERSMRTLQEIGFENVRLRCGDGSLGWPEAAPFDAIIVAAAAPRVPRALKRQLAESGRLAIPVGPDESVQFLYVIRRRGSDFEVQRRIPCRFVPLIGEEGFPPRDPPPQEPSGGY